MVARLPTDIEGELYWRKFMQEDKRSTNLKEMGQGLSIKWM